MNYAGRVNSFIFKGATVPEAIKEYRKMNGLTHLEFNYPEHIAGYDLDELKEAMGDLKVNGFAIRWRNRFINGNFTNPDPNLQREAIQMCKDGIDTLRKLGGSVITLWFENDGFDYPFQMDYEKGWNMMVEGIREVADYAHQDQHRVQALRGKKLCHDRQHRNDPADDRRSEPPQRRMHTGLLPHADEKRLSFIRHSSGGPQRQTVRSPHERWVRKTG